MTQKYDAVAQMEMALIDTLFKTLDRKVELSQALQAVGAAEADGLANIPVQEVHVNTPIAEIRKRVASETVLSEQDLRDIENAQREVLKATDPKMSEEQLEAMVKSELIGIYESLERIEREAKGLPVAPIESPQSPITDLDVSRLLGKSPGRG